MSNGYLPSDLVKLLRATHQLGAVKISEDTILVNYHNGAREFLTPSQAHCLWRNYDMLKELGMTYREFYTFDGVRLGANFEGNGL
jgi:hypothetical protein